MAQTAVQQQPPMQQPIPSSSPDGGETKGDENASQDAAPAPEPDHPLEHRWILYHIAPARRDARAGLSADEWKQGITEITSVDTVESFWRLFNNLEPLASLETGSSYTFFKEGIRPEWEDPANDGGGRWYLSYDAANRNKAEFSTQVDDTWMCAVLSVIGLSVDPADIVCGIVAAVRERETRFDIWTRKAPEAEILALGTALKKNLRWCTKLSYRFHRDRRGRTHAAYEC